MAKDLVQVQLSVPVYTSFDFCRSAPPPIHLMCWKAFVYLLLMTVKVRAHSHPVILISHLSCGAAHDSGVCCCPFGHPMLVVHIASLHHCVPVPLLLTCLYCASPCHLTTDQPDLWRVACGCNVEPLVV